MTNCAFRRFGPRPSCRARAPTAGRSRFPILYEDDALIAIDKPAGLAVHGGSGIAFGLIEQLRAARPEAKFLELVHRLDRDTSGVLLVAKKRAALVALHAALREGGVDKRYLVLVQGKWRDAKRTVELPLTKFLTGEGERRVRVEAGAGQAARTVFHRRKVWAGADPPVSLLEAELHTGRTHQIRVHLTHLGFPLAGDDKYGDFAWNKTAGQAGTEADVPARVATRVRASDRRADARARGAAAGGPRRVRRRARRSVRPGCLNRRSAFACWRSTGTARWPIRPR